MCLNVHMHLIYKICSHYVTTSKKLHVFLAHIKNNNLLRVKTLKMELFFNDMVEEIALEVYFELHRAVKLGYFEYCYPEET